MSVKKRLRNEYGAMSREVSDELNPIDKAVDNTVESMIALGYDEVDCEQYLVSYINYIFTMRRIRGGIALRKAEREKDKSS